MPKHPQVCVCCLCFEKNSFSQACAFLTTLSLCLHGHSFTEREWEAFNIVTLISSTIAAVCSLIACVTHYYNKNWNIAYLTAVTAMSSIFMITSFIVHYNYEISYICNSGHVLNTPFSYLV